MQTWIDYRVQEGQWEGILCEEYGTFLGYHTEVVVKTDVLCQENNEADIDSQNRLVWNWDKTFLAKYTRFDPEQNIESEGQTNDVNGKSR